MNNHQQALFTARQRCMLNRKVVCTGNPNTPGTLAQGFKKLFPEAVFLCRGTGWDLANLCDDSVTELKNIFKKCNTFLNCSYIAPGIQSRLLDICHSSVQFCDIVNIGSTHEYDGLGLDEYRESKLQLRNQSLRLNSFRFATCHFVLGGIKNDHSDQKKDWLDIDLICNAVVEKWNQPYHTPLVVMDQYKQPW